MGASRERGAGRRGQSTCSCLELGLLAGSARGFYEDFASEGFEMAQRGFVLGVLRGCGARSCWGAPAGSGQCWGHAGSRGAAAVSTEIEMRENFLSHCPSYKSMRERKRERERDFPQGSAAIKRLSFEKQ